MTHTQQRADEYEDKVREMGIIPCIDLEYCGPDKVRVEVIARSAADHSDLFSFWHGNFRCTQTVIPQIDAHRQRIYAKIVKRAKGLAPV